MRSIPNRVWQFERPCPIPSQICRWCDRNEGHCIRNGENPARPMSRIVNCVFLPCRLSAKPAQVRPDTIDQIIEKAHRIVESELEPKHKTFLVKFGSDAKMRIAGGKSPEANQGGRRLDAIRAR